MQNEFWHNAWEIGKTGWRQQKVNTRLQRYWPELELELEPGAQVLVPLCGDSLDIAWLREQGFAVTGVELSEVAIKRFFAQNALTASITTDREHKLYSAPGIRIFCGDFFQLRAAQVGRLTAVYDRAATVAMPHDLRADYARQLKALVEPGTPILLISMAYDQAKMKGPPFSVPSETVRELYGDAFSIEILGNAHGPKILGNLADRGLDELEETVYKLTRSSDT